MPRFLYFIELLVKTDFLNDRSAAALANNDSCADALFIFDNGYFFRADNRAGINPFILSVWLFDINIKRLHALRKANILAERNIIKLFDAAEINLDFP